MRRRLRQTRGRGSRAMRWAAEFSALAGALFLAAAAMAAEPLPAEKYAEIPPATAVRLSPDGTRLALTVPIQGKATLVIHNLGDGANQVMGLGEFQLQWVEWKSARRLVTGLRASTDRLFFGQSNRSADTRLVALDADGTNIRSIGEPPGGFEIGDRTAPGKLHPQFQDELASLLAADPHHVLQTVLDQYPVRDRRVTPSVWRVDVDTGMRERIVPSHPYSWTYMADASGTVRLAEGHEGAEQIFLVRDDGNGDWRELRRRDRNRDPEFTADRLRARCPRHALCRRAGSGRTVGALALRHAPERLRPSRRRRIGVDEGIARPQRPADRLRHAEWRLEISRSGLAARLGRHKPRHSQARGRAGRPDRRRHACPRPRCGAAWSGELVGAEPAGEAIGSSRRPLHLSCRRRCRHRAGTEDRLQGARRADDRGLADPPVIRVRQAAAFRRAAAWRPAGLRPRRFRLHGPVPRQPRLWRAAAGIPRLDLLDRGIRTARLQAVGPGDAGRRDRRDALARPAEARRSRAALHRRRELRRLCGARRRREGARPLSLRRRLGRPSPI